MKQSGDSTFSWDFGIHFTESGEKASCKRIQKDSPVGIS